MIVWMRILCHSQLFTFDFDARNYRGEIYIHERKRERERYQLFFDKKL